MNENFHTPLDATQKRCPVMPLVEEPIAGGAGVWVNGVETKLTRMWPRRCVGTDCMMWTWVAGSTQHGYCGLRGKVVIP